MNRTDVCALIVTFHPDEDFAARAERIARQVGSLILVDNASGAQALAMLEGIAAAGARSTRLLRNPSNLGVAQALNAGIAQAEALGYRWVLLMDQDSLIHEDLVDSLISVLASQPVAGQVAVVGAGYRDPLERPIAPGEAEAARAWDEVDWVITSGSLLSIEAYRVIGPFREEFFIDYVDLEYCVRARARGYRVLRARAALMHHVIGAPSQHRLLGSQKWTSNHSPDRRYYRARNDTVMLRESGRYRFGSWRLKSLARSVRTCKRVLLYERGKWTKIRAVLEGWWDGIHGRLGIRGSVTR
ncbi:MAG TPA: glycosyltransferase family 2 protein [Steroidobacteraceae bacterium]|nr:glycosyltransferase family 2 protein [Steroidobacteraceae bacterium]